MLFWQPCFHYHIFAYVWSGPLAVTFEHKRYPLTTLRFGINMTWLGKGKDQSLNQMELLFQVGMLVNSNTLQKLT